MRRRRREDKVAGGEVGGGDEGVHFRGSPAAAAAPRKGARPHPPLRAFSPTRKARRQSAHAILRHLPNGGSGAVHGEVVMPSCLERREIGNRR